MRVRPLWFSTLQLLNTWLLKLVFLFKAQLSAAEKESNAITASEVGALKQTIADKDKEIEQLSGELQTLEVQLKEMGNSWSEKGEEVHRLMVKTLELNDRLVKVEGEKQERERRLEATHQQMEFLKQLIAELRKKCPIAQVPHTYFNNFISIGLL